MMTTTPNDTIAQTDLTAEQFAHLGEGTVGYVRKITSDDLLARYPGIAEIDPGLEVWALFGASGMPILLTDRREGAMAGAMQNDLHPVAVH